MKKSIKKYTRSKAFKECLRAATEMEEAFRRVAPEIANAMLLELQTIRKILEKSDKVVLVVLCTLLLCAAPAFAASIVLTGGTIDIHTPSHRVTLIGPDLFYTGQVSVDVFGNIEPGRFHRIGIEGPLVGTLTYQGLTYPMGICFFTVGPTCGSIRTITEFVVPADATSVTVPFALTGDFRPGQGDGLAERVDFTGQGLLTVQPLFLLHYEITDNTSEITGTPEPSTWLLLLSGLGLLLCCRRKVLCGI